MGHKPINMKPLAMVGLLAASFATIAADGDNIGTVTFKTAPEATVTELKGLYFGDQMAVASGTSCIMVAKLEPVSGTQNQLKVNNTTTTFEGDQCGGSGGSGSNAAYLSTKAQMGIFEITGVNGQQVNLQVSSDTTDPYLSFTASVEYWNGGLNTITEAAPSMTPVTNTDVTLGALRSLVATQPHPSAIGTVVVGGTLSSKQSLETSKEYSLTYTLDVTYL